MKREFEKFIEALHEGVVPATGCTEPVAVAYGAAVCAKYLPSKKVDKIDVHVSLNIMKNAMAVMVPGTKEPGLQIAASAGALVGNPNAKLKVISKIKNSDLPEIKTLAHSGKVKVSLAKVDDDLYVDVTVVSGKDSVTVYIADDHTNIFKIVKNDQILYEKDRPKPHAKSALKLYMQTQKFENIWDFAMEIPLEKIAFMKKSADLNVALSKEGLTNSYGMNLGRSLVEDSGKATLENQILTYTVAASDARMGGATLPAMSNSGSGNQGISATVPVWVVAKENNSSEEKLIRALTLSHLTAIYIHAFLPVLSAFCAADSAAMGASVGACYLLGGDFETASMSIKNMAGDSVGMVCDGAGCSCAMKVASSVSSMYRGMKLAMKGIVVPSSNGLVCNDVDETIRGIGELGSQGLKETDPVILDIMMNKS
ncbi:serine dehydratase subunit alpha family protein [Companilactobacillus halodurans]|uniref:UPF0597 protein FHL05_00765 n=1 Tax=Companilactobacillus halodurans TaxID=2584183 RepID=A0A5P0ZTQ0_9LACO|nr:L-serine ammonia-lyase, iron-sulfur-dependent, subunit alpha [Companilactobacillus halodurans]MQS75988.1 serine dehydratase subunit alpha family protein [Companilactobacillus halodurans]MQS96423.1 serine dehydratase subunit alpha family protein [Companilactobacillus halodurans]